MNARDITLVSASVAAGALASAIAVRFLSRYSRKSFADEIDNLAVDAKLPLENSCAPNPFDPSKRKGFCIRRIALMFRAFCFILFDDFSCQVSLLG